MTQALTKKSVIKAAGAEEQLKDFGFQCECLLGEGSFSQVVKATELASGRSVAVKVVFKEGVDEASWGRISREFKAMMLLSSHPSVLKLLDTLENNSFIFFVLEFCSKGDLLKYVLQEDGVCEREAKIIFRQVVEGIRFAHQEGWVHRDLKLENIMRTENGSARIADWGFACPWSPVKRMNESCGSVHYASPEICSGGSYRGPEVDVWSLGVTLYSLVSGRMPFFGQNNLQIIGRVTSGTFPMHAGFSPDLQKLILGMLAVDPVKRLTIPQIQSHPWLSHSVPKIRIPTSTFVRPTTFSSTILEDRERTAEKFERKDSDVLPIAREGEGQVEIVEEEEDPSDDTKSSFSDLPREMLVTQSQELNTDDVLASMVLRSSPLSGLSPRSREAFGKKNKSPPTFHHDSNNNGTTTTTTIATTTTTTSGLTASHQFPAKTSPLSSSTPAHRPQAIDPRKRRRKSVVELTMEVMDHAAEKEKKAVDNKQSTNNGHGHNTQNETTILPTTKLVPPFSPSDGSTEDINSPGRKSSGLTTKLRGFIRSLLSPRTSLPSSSGALSPPKETPRKGSKIVQKVEPQLQIPVPVAIKKSPSPLVKAYSFKSKEETMMKDPSSYPLQRSQSFSVSVLSASAGR